MKRSEGVQKSGISQQESNRVGCVDGDILMCGEENAEQEITENVVRGQGRIFFAYQMRRVRYGEGGRRRETRRTCDEGKDGSDICRSLDITSGRVHAERMRTHLSSRYLFLKIRGKFFL